MSISPDDPRLTAFALGELAASERAEVEALLADDAESRAIVADIQATARILTDHLLAEPRPRLDPSRRRAIEACLEPRLILPPRRKRWLNRWTKFAVAASLLIGLGTTILWRGSPKREPAPAAPIMSSPMAVEPQVAFAPAPAPSMAPAPAPDSPALLRSDPAALGAMVASADANPPATGGRGIRSMVGLEPPSPASPGQAMTQRARAKVMVEQIDAAKPAEARAAIVDNPFIAVVPDDSSSLPVRCESESYTEVRRYLNQGTAPPKDSVRIEELINYFTYSYPQPLGSDPFSVNVEVARCPWKPEHRLVRVGLKGRDAGPIAKDVKIEVKFNPDRASQYRLIGYENRILPETGRPDAGEVTARHSVTALYEVIPAEPAKRSVVVQRRSRVQSDLELVEVDLSCKTVEGTGIQSLKCPADDKDGEFAAASDDFKFATAVAGFGLLLRDSQYKGTLTWPTLEEMATQAVGAAPTGDRKEFLDLVRKAKAAKGQAR